MNKLDRRIENIVSELHAHRSTIRSVLIKKKSNSAGSNKVIPLFLSFAGGFLFEKYRIEQYQKGKNVFVKKAVKLLASQLKSSTPLIVKYFASSVLLSKNKSIHVRKSAQD